MDDDLETVMYEAGRALLDRDDPACAAAIRHSFTLLQERRALDHHFYENLLKTGFDAGLEATSAASFECLCGAALLEEKVWELGWWYFGDLARQMIERGFAAASEEAIAAYDQLGVRTGAVANQNQVFSGFLALLRGMHEAKFGKVIAPVRSHDAPTKGAVKTVTMFPTEPPE